MITNIEKTKYGLEGKVNFELFNKTIDVLMDEEIDLDYANLCAKALNNLDEKTIDNLCQYSINYCIDFCNEVVDEEAPDFNSVRDVLDYINPSLLIINVPKEKDKIVIHLELNCEWEIEHGLEWTINNGEILYVGAFESEDGWSDISYYKDLNWNYVFNETYCVLKNIPCIDILKKSLIAMSALDIILNEEEWLRTYNYNPNWDNKASLGEIDNGGGDNMNILFSEDGCIIKGFDHESELSPHAQEEFKVWKGIYEDVPKNLLELLEDEASEKEDVTFCIWRESEAYEWKKGKVEIPKGYDDGSSYMLGRIYNDAEEYLEWAKDYYDDLEDNIPVELIEDIFNFKPMTKEIIKGINKDRECEESFDQLKEIGYPVE